MLDSSPNFRPEARVAGIPFAAVAVEASYCREPLHGLPGRSGRRGEEERAEADPPTGLGQLVRQVASRCPSALVSSNPAGIGVGRDEASRRGSATSVAPCP